MYATYFGLTEQPFQLCTDPKFLFLSPAHARARAYLIYAICDRDGIVTITGGIGAGKSTLVNEACQCLDDDTDVVVLHQTQLDEVQFIQSLLFGMGLEMVPGGKAELLDNARALLIDRQERGRKTVLIVDDAQNLSAVVLEELRMLMDDEYHGRKLLSLVLVGQRGLRRTLAAAGLEQVRERIRLNYHIDPLSALETGRYIRHRLRIAGAETRDVFSPAARALIYRYTFGVPRRINILCDMAMTAAHLRRARRVTAECVREALLELGWSSQPGRWHTHRALSWLRETMAMLPKPGRPRQARKVGQWSSASTADASLPRLWSQAGVRAQAAAAASRTIATTAARECARYGQRAWTAVRAESRRMKNAVNRLRDGDGTAMPGSIAAGASRFLGRLSSKLPEQPSTPMLAATFALAVASLALILGDDEPPAERIAHEDVGPEAPALPNMDDILLVPASYARERLQRTAAFAGPPNRLVFAVRADARQDPVLSAGGTSATEASQSDRHFFAADWILSQKPTDYTIQILGSFDHERLESFAVRQDPELIMAVYEVRRKNRDWFVLLSGTFPDFASARRALDALPEAMRGNGPWIRRFDDIQQAIRGTKAVSRQVRIRLTGGEHPG